MAINEKYSYKSWKRQSFTGKDPKEFNDSEIYNAAFHQHEPFTDVFPALMKGVTFIGCNLDNCNIPTGNTVGENSCNLHHAPQKDGVDWVVGKDLKPVRPLNEKAFNHEGLSKDPQDIVECEPGVPIIIKKREQTKKLIESLKKDDSALEQILKDQGVL